MSDEADKAQALIEAEILHAVASAKINGAGGDIVSEDFDGFCVDCGEEIPPKRLEVVPNAVRCIICQEKLEKRRY